MFITFGMLFVLGKPFGMFVLEAGRLLVYMVCISEGACVRNRRQQRCGWLIAFVVWFGDVSALC